MANIKSLRKPYKVKKKKPIFKNRIFWLALLILAVIIGIIYFLFFSPVFKIKEIQVDGNKEIPTEEILKVTDNVLSSGGKNFFWHDNKKIQEEILRLFPIIVEVKVKAGFPDKLTLEIKERGTVALFFGEGRYFAIDEGGIVFKEAKSDNALVKITDQQKNFPPVLGEKIIEKDLLDKILEINKKITEELKIKIIECNILADRLVVKTSEDWNIYFDSEKEAEWQITKLKMVLEREIPSDKRKTLDYVELRFGNYTYYKYKD